MIRLIDIVLKMIDLITYIGLDELFSKVNIIQNKKIEYYKEYGIEIIKKCVNCDNIINGEMYCYKDNYYCSELCRLPSIKEDSKSNNYK